MRSCPDTYISNYLSLSQQAQTRTLTDGTHSMESHQPVWATLEKIKKKSNLTDPFDIILQYVCHSHPHHRTHSTITRYLLRISILIRLALWACWGIGAFLQQSPVERAKSTGRQEKKSMSSVCTACTAGGQYRSAHRSSPQPK